MLNECVVCRSKPLETVKVKLGPQVCVITPGQTEMAG